MNSPSGVHVAQFDGWRFSKNIVLKAEADSTRMVRPPKCHIIPTCPFLFLNVTGNPTASIAVTLSTGTVGNDASRSLFSKNAGAFSEWTYRTDSEPISIKPLNCGFIFSGLLSHVVLIECLPHENFDDRLPADVELTGRDIQFVQHILSEVHIDSLYRRHHSTCIRKVAGDVLAALSLLSNRFG